MSKKVSAEEMEEIREGFQKVGELAFDVQMLQLYHRVSVGV